MAEHSGFPCATQPYAASIIPPWHPPLLPPHCITCSIESGTAATPFAMANADSIAPTAAMKLRTCETCETGRRHAQTQGRRCVVVVVVVVVWWVVVGGCGVI